jgi:hypothetical protein
VGPSGPSALPNAMLASTDPKVWSAKRRTDRQPTASRALLGLGHAERERQHTAAVGIGGRPPGLRVVATRLSPAYSTASARLRPKPRELPVISHASGERPRPKPVSPAANSSGVDVVQYSAAFGSLVVLARVISLADLKTLRSRRGAPLPNHPCGSMTISIT